MPFIVEDNESQYIGYVRQLTEFSMPLKGGYLAGLHPGGLTMVEGAPTAATVRVVYRPEAGSTGDGCVVAETQSAPNGTWFVGGLDPNRRYDVVARRSGHNDVIVANVKPVAQYVVSAIGAFIENTSANGLVGEYAIDGGIPPYSVVAHESIVPEGIEFSVVDGKLTSTGTTTESGPVSFQLKVQAANEVFTLVSVDVTLSGTLP